MGRKSGPNRAKKNAAFATSSTQPLEYDDWDKYGEGSSSSTSQGQLSDGSDWDTFAPKTPPKSKEELAREEAAAQEAQKKAALDEKLKGWPWKGAPEQLVTIAPMFLNIYCGVLALEFDPQKDCKFMDFVDTPGIRELIFDELFRYHSSVSAFSSTCQKASFITESTLGFWDLNSFRFNIRNLKSSTANAEYAQGWVPSNLVVAPFRGSSFDSKTHLFRAQVENLLGLGISVQYRYENFKRVHLHRIAFLSSDVLALLIPQMPKLEVLGIYKCPLLHIGKAEVILDIITRDRPKGKEYQVALDWFPNLHIGPDPELVPPEFFTGGYGATWDNWHGETDRAIWCIVSRYLMICKVRGIDAVSPKTQFRRWLEAGPCWDVENTLNAMIAGFGIDQLPVGHSKDKIAFRFPELPTKYGDDQGHPDIAEREYLELSLNRKFDRRVEKLIEAVVAIDRRNKYHSGSIRKFFTVNEYLRPEGFKWMFLQYPCRYCEYLTLGVFFHYADVKAYNEQTDHGRDATAAHALTCMACRLDVSLDQETDHFKGFKRDLIKEWLFEETEDGVVLNSTDLSKFIDNYGPREIQQWAECLDERREHHIKHNGYDEETEARQRPDSEQVLESRRGAFLRAPRIGEWEEHLRIKEFIAKNPSEAQWSGVHDKTKYLAHHRYYGGNSARLSTRSRGKW